MAEPTAVGTINYLRDGYQDVLSNEKRALLALTAQHGTDAQIEYERQRQAALDARKNSLEAAAARGGAVNMPAALNAELTQDYDKLLGAMSNGASASQVTHGREMDRIAAANAAYIDAMRAQAPLLQSQLDAQIAAAKLQADAAAKAGRGGGGGGGGGGFGGLLGDGLPSLEEEKPGADIVGIANSLAEKALRLPQTGLANREGARQAVLGDLVRMVQNGEITQAEAEQIGGVLQQSFAAVDNGTAVYSSAGLMQRNANSGPGQDKKGYSGGTAAYTGRLSPKVQAAAANLAAGKPAGFQLTPAELRLAKERARIMVAVQRTRQQSRTTRTPQQTRPNRTPQQTVPNQTARPNPMRSS